MKKKIVVEYEKKHEFGKVFEFELSSIAPRDQSVGPKDVATVIYSGHIPLVVVGEGERWMEAGLPILIDTRNGQWYFIEEWYSEDEEDALDFCEVMDDYQTGKKLTFKFK